MNTYRDNTKRKHAHNEVKPNSVDLERLALALESVVGEPVTGVLTFHGVTLLLLWQEAWDGLNAKKLNPLEAIQLNAELIQVGRIMQAYSMISVQASNRLNYSVFSLTQHHLQREKHDNDEVVIELNSQDNEGESALNCQYSSYAFTQN